MYARYQICPRRLMAVLLTLVMLFGILSVGANAATMDNVRHYDTYVCLGDSIAEGFGPDNPDYVGLKRVPFAYHSFVADAVTADNFYPMARPGGSTSEVLYFLDNTVAYDSSYFRIPLEQEAAEALRVQIRDVVKKADLITLNVGSNDLFTTSLFAVAAVLYADTEIPEDVQKMIDNYGDYGQVFQELILRANKLGRLPEVIRTFSETFTAAYQQFRTNWNLICKSIYELNPDVTLVAVGFFNPVKSLRLSGNSMEIGQMMDSIALMMNTFVRYHADYSRQYLYADVYDTECYKLLPVDDPNFAATMVPNVHPTHDGHRFMAEQIVKVLPERGEEPVKQFPFTDVPKDSWFYDNVYYVWDNGIMDGMTDTTFAPNDKTTRAQFAAVLYRMADRPAVTDADRAACPFTDLKADWYQDAVVWAYQKQGSSTASPDTTFAPNDPVTREQMVAMLYRYKGEPAKNADLSVFADRGRHQRPTRVRPWPGQSKTKSSTAWMTARSSRRARPPAPSSPPSSAAGDDAVTAAVTAARERVASAGGSAFVDPPKHCMKGLAFFNTSLVPYSYFFFVKFFAIITAVIIIITVPLFLCARTIA